MVDEMPSIMAIEDAAKYLSMNPLTLRRLARDGGIPAFKLGRQWRFKRELLDQWIVKQSEMKTDRASESEECCGEDVAGEARYIDLPPK